MKELPQYFLRGKILSMCKVKNNRHKSLNEPKISATTGQYIKAIMLSHMKNKEK